MIPRLLAFDLDGTLLTDDKKFTQANKAALLDMAAAGAKVALATGRIGSSIMRYADQLDIDMALLTLNGAAVYKSKFAVETPVYSIALPALYSDYIIAHTAGKDFCVNFYCGGRLYAVRSKKTQQWINLYFSQTGSQYQFVDSLSPFIGKAPFKIIFIGDPRRVDELEKQYRRLWGDQIYLVRTWDYYLEFLNRDATKGRGLTALAKAFGIGLADVVAFGDAANDIPMLRAAGIGIAMANAPDDVKAAASRVSPWTNNEDGVAREWERMKKETV